MIYRLQHLRKMGVPCCSCTQRHLWWDALVMHGLKEGLMGHARPIILLFSLFTFYLSLLTRRGPPSCVFVLFSLLFRVGVWSDWLPAPLEVVLTHPRIGWSFHTHHTHTLSFIFSSLSSLYFHLYTLCGRVSCFCTPVLPSLPLLVLGVWADQLPDPWMGEAPSDDRVVFSSTHSLTHFDYVPYPFISIHIYTLWTSLMCVCSIRFRPGWGGEPVAAALP